MNLTIDPDVTAESHIYNALQRAEPGSDYSVHVNNHHLKSDQQETKPNDALKQKSNFIPKLFPGKETTAMRIRRWTGREKVGRKNHVMPLNQSSLKLQSNPKTQHFPSPRQEQAQRFKDNLNNGVDPKIAEAACRIYRARRTQVVPKRPTFAVHGKKQTQTKYLGADVKDELVCQDKLEIEPGNLNTKKTPVSKPSASTRFDLDENTGFPPVKMTPVERYGEICKQLYLSDLCRVLSQKTFPANTNDFVSDVRIPENQAQRIIKDYYNRKDKQSNRTNAVVVIHLPNQTNCLRTAITAKSEPKFSLRNGETTSRNSTILEQIDDYSSGVFLTEPS